MGENKEPKIPWHFKPTQLGARGRKLQTSLRILWFADTISKLILYDNAMTKCVHTMM